MCLFLRINFNIGPDEGSRSNSSSSSSDDDIEAARKVKLKHDYKSKYENWKKAKVCAYAT